MNREQLIEYLERVLAGYFSANKMPDMSGDMRKRLTPYRLRELQEAVREVLTAIEAQGMAVVPVEATDSMVLAAWCPPPADKNKPHMQGPSTNDSYRAMIEAGKL